MADLPAFAEVTPTWKSTDAATAAKIKTARESAMNGARSYEARLMNFDPRAGPMVATQFKGRLTGTLTDVFYIELDADFEPIVEGDCLYLAEGTFEAAQYERLAALLRALVRRYPIADVAGHQHVAPGRKADPGAGFDWAALAGRLHDLPLRWPADEAA